MRFTDLEEQFKEFQKEFGVEFDEGGHIISESYEKLDSKTLRIVIMFKSILEYLEEKLNQETGFYD